MCKNSHHKFKRTISRHGPTISKWCVIHLRVQYVDETLIFLWDFIFSDDYVEVRWISHDLWFYLGFNCMHFNFHVRFWNWHVIYWWWSPRLENACLIRPNREVTFASFWFTMYGFAPFQFTVYSFAPFNLPKL